MILGHPHNHKVIINFIFVFHIEFNIVILL